jgi:aspartyl-tRNA(Asn)/glutamyl-tRNA(Gln) amidotransferase subunit B
MIHPARTSSEYHMDYEPIICFETHVELKTESKLFCSCPVRPDAPPNSCTCPICTGQPGTLPVLNKKAVELAIRAGMALGCRINSRSRFARKNYFYPDLPKGYQISQYELPFCEHGSLCITGEDGNPYEVGIARIHLEEDAGKLVHSPGAGWSLVDFNRASVPLLEIVADHTRNPLRSVREAVDYLQSLRLLLRHIDISDCMIERGQFRCDVNISLRRLGAAGFGDRVEIKNMASFKAVGEALDYEIRRQAELLDSGDVVAQETRLYDEAKKITVAMRTKENAPDYRYFPDPDLPEVVLESEFLRNVEKNIPELPDRKVMRLTGDFGISRGDAIILGRDRSLCDFFEAAAVHCPDAKKLCAWIIKDLFKLMNTGALDIKNPLISPKNFGRLVTSVSEGSLTDILARDVLAEMCVNGETPDEIIKRKNLEPMQDEAALNSAVCEVIKANPEAVNDAREGKRQAVNFLIGQVMKKTRGRADPRKISEMLYHETGA